MGHATLTTIIFLSVQYLLSSPVAKICPDAKFVSVVNGPESQEGRLPIVIWIYVSFSISLCVIVFSLPIFNGNKTVQIIAVYQTTDTCIGLF